MAIISVRFVHSESLRPSRSRSVGSCLEDLAPVGQCLAFIQPCVTSFLFRAMIFLLNSFATLSYE